jgi:hypothetical protein
VPEEAVMSDFNWLAEFPLGFVSFSKPILKTGFLGKCVKFKNRFLKFKKPVLETRINM